MINAEIAFEGWLTCGVTPGYPFFTISTQPYHNFKPVIRAGHPAALTRVNRVLENMSKLNFYDN